MTADKYALPALLVVLAAAIAAVFQAMARSRRADRDTGDFWAGVLSIWGFAVAILTLLSAALARSIEALWQSGYHLQLDRLAPGEPYYRAALFAPLGLWVLVLVAIAARKPAEARTARWVAGGIGFSPSRTWILLAAAPIALVLLLVARTLRSGEEAYPGAFWGSLATVVVTLVALAASRGEPVGAAPAVAPEKRAATERPASLVPWPEALREQGVIVEPILPQPAAGGPSVLAGRAFAAGSQSPLSTTQSEVLDCLFRPPGASGERSCLLLAPDDMGQMELVAEAASTLLGQSREAALVVVPTDPNGLLERLRGKLPPATRAEVMRPGRLLGGADLWVVDADTLSDSLLPRLGGEPSLARLGLVVWWDAHSYTGVLAANMWAVSRRLDRLIRASGRGDVRALVVMRSTPDPGAQLGRYVRRLFPYDLREIPSPPAGPRDIAPYRIDSHTGFFDGRRDHGMPAGVRHPGLTAALASMRARYATFADSPPGTSRSEQDAFNRLDVSGEAVSACRVEDPKDAAAAIRHLRAGDALALPEIVRGTGRASTSSGPAYVGVVAPSNPYARYVLSSRFPVSAREASRRLVCAGGRPRIVERHLLLALSELEDTREGLRTTSLWNEDVVRGTLDRLAREGKLMSTETRWLGKDGRLRIDRLYKSLKSLPEHIRPLDTSGTEPVLVREVSAKDGGIRRMVDRERLPIVAYPQRVFTSDGVRYEVRDWDSLERVGEWVECQVQDKHRVTFRRRDVRVAEIKSTRAPVRAARSAHPIVRQAAEIVYEETVRGVHALIFEGGVEKEHHTSFPKPLRTRFETQALLVELPSPVDHAGLASVAQALRHVLPVHLGVEEDALEVVPILEGSRGRVALVDLFPGGIGLVPAVLDDDDFLLAVLGHCHDWLAVCPCQDANGCRECLRTLEATAANPDNAHRREAALNVLSRMVSRGAPRGPR